jgi:hypothetical protein
MNGSKVQMIFTPSTGLTKFNLARKLLSIPVVEFTTRASLDWQ